MKHDARQLEMFLGFYLGGSTPPPSKGLRRHDRRASKYRSLEQWSYSHPDWERREQARLAFENHDVEHLTDLQTEFDWETQRRYE